MVSLLELQFVVEVSISLLLCLTAAAAPSIALPNCTSKCGNVSIPYPFGIGSKCSYNSSFEISCNNSKPFLSKYNLEVLEVDFTVQTVQLLMQSGAAYSKCPATTGPVPRTVNFADGPFRYSRTNDFRVKGCGNALLIHGKEIMAGCTSGCINSTAMINFSDVEGCNGLGCCETEIPTDLEVYDIVISGNTQNCTKAFLSAKTINNWYSINETADIDQHAVNMVWTLVNMPTDYCDGYRYEWGRNYYYKRVSCKCGEFYEGNPFLPGGCKVRPGCANCEKECVRGPFKPFRDADQYFKYRKEYCDPFRDHYCDDTFFCNHSNKAKKILGASLGGALMLVVLCGFILLSYKHQKKERILQIKKKKFEKNGGLLLQQQISSDEGMVEKTIVFTSIELEKATDDFNDSRILGRGGQGTVYKGILTDGKIIAIKMSKVIDESQLQQFINEVVILSKINHRNIVKLLGCCLETEVPLLVYEFVPNGNLSEFVHDQNEEFPLSWKMRLQIAIEIAGALAYLHSAASIPIYHRDIKSTNILLDEKLRAKVADFGTSRSIAIEQTHLTTVVQGTFGYLDPEYFQSSQFTDKSDVYSYGVVLVELLTGKKAISSIISEEDRSLATRFISCMKDMRLFDLLDPRVKEEAMLEEITAVANVAKRCLNLSGRKRPTMTEVMMELEGIRMSHMPVTAPRSFKEDRNIMEMEGPIDTPQSSYQAGVFSRNASSSDAAPLRNNIV